MCDYRFHGRVRRTSSQTFSGGGIVIGLHSLSNNLWLFAKSCDGWIHFICHCADNETPFLLAVKLHKFEQLLSAGRIIQMQVVEVMALCTLARTWRMKNHAVDLVGSAQFIVKRSVIDKIPVFS